MTKSCARRIMQHIIYGSHLLSPLMIVMPQMLGAFLLSGTDIHAPFDPYATTHTQKVNSENEVLKHPFHPIS